MPQPLRDQITQHLKETMGLGDEDVAELLDMAQNITAESMTQIGGLLDAGEFKGIGEAAHTLKGNLLNMGLDAMADQAKGMETGVKSGDLALVRTHYQTLLSLLAQF